MGNNFFEHQEFAAVRDYLLWRVSVSGMGKVYIEYPLPELLPPSDGIKRGAVVEANNYDLRYDAENQQIFAKSQQYLFIYLADGAIIADNKNVDTTIIAKDLFLYLLREAKHTKIPKMPDFF
jgi:hypothetical protein